MKKIMFNDRYGLTEAVLERRKTMTRRVKRIDFCPDSREEQIEKFCKCSATDAKGRQVWLGFDNKGNRIAQLISHYAIGEEVAVAQKYKDCWDIYQQRWEAKNDPSDWHTPDAILGDEVDITKGWTNKMFVRADLMSHRIRITGIRVERMQDISDEDCLKEGLIAGEQEPRMFGFHLPKGTILSFLTPRAAFAALIDKVSGRGTWERNPWVFVYEFELVK